MFVWIPGWSTTSSTQSTGAIQEVSHASNSSPSVPANITKFLEPISPPLNGRIIEDGYGSNSLTISIDNYISSDGSILDNKIELEIESKNIGSDSPPNKQLTQNTNHSREASRMFLLYKRLDPHKTWPAN